MCNSLIITGVVFLCSQPINQDTSQSTEEGWKNQFKTNAFTLLIDYSDLIRFSQTISFATSTLSHRAPLQTWSFNVTFVSANLQTPDRMERFALVKKIIGTKIRPTKYPAKQFNNSIKA